MSELEISNFNFSVHYNFINVLIPNAPIIILVMISLVMMNIATNKIKN